MKFSAFLITAAALAVSTSAQAGTVYSQDFSAGLNANESVAGNFTVNNGTVGHSGFYSNNEYSFYQLALDLTGVTGAMLQFDWTANIETHFDRFNVLASTGAFSPPSGLLTPVTPNFYTDEGDDHHANLGQIAYAGYNSNAGTLVFDLGAFDGQMVNLRMQFGSDSSVTSSGFNFDNVLVTGNAVPEPATWAMMIGGLGLVGASMRRRSVQISFA